MTIVRRAVALSTIVLASASMGCGPSPSAYLTSVTSFAGTTGDGVASLGALPNTAAAVCRKRAVARYLKRHILPSDQAPPPRWEDYYGSAKEADGTLSWKDYCADIQATATNFSSLLKVLGDYASALKALAASGTWDGSPMSTALTKSASLVGSKTPAGTALSSLGPPAQALGIVVVAKYTADRTHDFARAADVPFQSILDGLNNYLVAVKRDVVDPTKKEREEVVNLLETKGAVWSATPDASRIIAFATYAQSVDDDLTAIDVQIMGYAGVIAKLKTGHGNLVSKPQDDSSSKDIVVAATEILAAITQVEAAIAGTSGK